MSESIQPACKFAVGINFKNMGIDQALATTYKFCFKKQTDISTNSKIGLETHIISLVMKPLSHKKKKRRL